MPRNRVIYQTEAVYVGPTPSTGKHYSNAVWGGGTGAGAAATSGYNGTNLISELLRVQSANYGYNRALVDVNQFGELAAIDRIQLEQPTVNLEVNWLVANLNNEKAIGFNVQPTGMVSGWVSAISGFLTKATDEKNYFIRTTSEGVDVHGNGDALNDSVIAIGNGFMSSYQTEASVGNFPTATVRIEGLNMEWDATTSGNNIPAVNPTDGSAITGWYYVLPAGTSNVGGKTTNSDYYSLSVLRPGDISLTLKNNETITGVSFSDMKIQSYTLSFDLNRQNLQKLGSKYAFAKEPQFPVTVSLAVNGVVGDSVAGSLIEVLNANGTYNPIVKINAPGTSTTVAVYELRGAKLDSVDYTSSIGPAKTANLNFSTQIGGPNQTSIGLFMSGYAY